jgi:hypothetical protein
MLKGILLKCQWGFRARNRKRADEQSESAAAEEKESGETE